MLVAILARQQQLVNPQSRLTPAAAVIIAIAVAVVTAGAGTAAMGTAGVAVAGTGGVAVGTAVGTTVTIAATATAAASTVVVVSASTMTMMLAASAAISAGVASISSTALISTINNGGDMGEVLDEIGSDEYLKQLAISVVTAGVTAGAADVLGYANATPAAGTAANPTGALTSATLKAGQHATKVLVNSTIGAGVETIVNGDGLDEFGENWTDRARAGAVLAIGAEASQVIGEAAKGGKINDVTQIAFHGALGCAIGAATSGDCGSGAIGGAIGEAAAKLYADDDLKSLEASFKNGEISASEYQTSVFELANDASKIGQFSALGVALASGTDVEGINTANDTATNALENNFVFTATIAASAIIYTALVGRGNVLDGLEVIGNGNDPLSEAVASGVEKGVELSMEKFPEATTATLKILAGAGEIMDTTVTYWDDETNNYVSKKWNSIDPTIRSQLGGAGKVVSIVIPAGTVGKIAQMKKVKLPDVKYSGISPFAGKIADKADISHLSPLRQNYIREVWSLEKKGQELLKSGKTSEEVAKILSLDRRNLGVIYKDMTSPEHLEIIHKQNLLDYDDKLGPTMEFLRKNGKSWEQIIESAAKPGGRDIPGTK